MAASRRDAKKLQTLPGGFRLHPYLRGNRPFIRPRVAIDLRMRKWKDYPVMERAITGAVGEARELSPCLSIYQSSGTGPLRYLSIYLVGSSPPPPTRPSAPIANMSQTPKPEPLCKLSAHFVTLALRLD